MFWTRPRVARLFIFATLLALIVGCGEPEPTVATTATPAMKTQLTTGINPTSSSPLEQTIDPNDINESGNIDQTSETMGVDSQVETSNSDTNLNLGKESSSIDSVFTITPALCEDTDGPNCEKLRLGDDYLTTSRPARGYLYSCNGKNPNAPGTTANKITWIDVANDTWNILTKLWLPAGMFSPGIGTYTETISNGHRQIDIRNLPVDGEIGDWPMTNYANLTEIDRNPGIPEASNSSFSYSIDPPESITPTCVSLGAIGVTKNGVVIYNAADGRGDDAVAREIVDVFGGHPAGSNYHYHFIPERLDNEYLADGHSGIVGYINDGFPIYGYKGEYGLEMSNIDLDTCHGHKHGVLGYHYHATIEYPYTVGCYAGSPVEDSAGVSNTNQGSTMRGSSQELPNIQHSEPPRGRPDCLPPNPPQGRDKYPPDWLNLDPCP